MKNVLKNILSFAVTLTFILSSLAYTVSAADKKKDIDWSLWDKFIRYDLCITDYDSLTDKEKELCKFIFETEQSSDKVIRCERARRTLAGDKYIGERINLEQLNGAYGIWDNYSWSKYGSQRYIHCVPDIKCLDGWESYNEYWVDDEGSIRVKYDGENYGTMFDEIIVSGKKSYTVKPTELPEIDSNLEEFIEVNGDYYYISSDNTVVLAKSRYSPEKYNGFNGDIGEPIDEPVIIPDEVNGYPVTAIEGFAFANAPITEVVLPESIEFIDAAAFGNCLYLKNINFPEGLKYMNANAFLGAYIPQIEANCPELNIPSFAFVSNFKLTDVKLNVKSIDDEAFGGCLYLKKLTLGNDIEKIGAKAFYDCGAIESFNIPESVKIIGCGAFAGDTEFGRSGIKSITIPSTVEILGALPRQRGEAPTSGIEVPATYPLTDQQPDVVDSDCVISGWYSTEAHSYAISHNLKFNPLDDIAYGDTNNDGEINITDAVILQKYLLRCGTVGYEADVNKDGKINVFDMIVMKRNLIDDKI